METKTATESAQFAGKLQQAVLNLKAIPFAGTLQVHRMARSLALAELQRARSNDARLTAG